MGQLFIELDGISCGSCIGRIEAALNRLEKDLKPSVNLGTNTLTITSQSHKDILAVLQTLESIGYSPRLESIKWQVENIRCGSCVKRIESGLQSISGILKIEVNQATDSVMLSILPKVITSSEVAAHLEQLGYPVKHPVADTPSAFWDRREFFTILFGLVCCIPLMLPMLFMPFGIHFELSGFWQLLLATPIQFLLGKPFYVGAYHAVKSKAGNMDLLVALGSSAAYLLSLYYFIQSFTTETDITPAYYFESAAVIVTLVRFGKYLESGAKRKTTAAIAALMKLRPETTTIMKDTGPESIPIAKVRVGNRLQIKVGETVPTDCKVLEGTSHIDESMITGEQLPLTKGPNDVLIGGTINLDGILIVEATAIGRNTTLSKIINLVEEAQMKKAPIQHLVDRISYVFVPIVLVLAVITAVVWVLVSGDMEIALIHAVSVLVIACPCALGLATPTAIMVGTGTAAKFGILIKDNELLQRISQINIVAFDKTGTLTEGNAVLETYKAMHMEGESMLRICHGMLLGSEHHLGKAFLRFANEHNISPSPSTETRVIPGIGISAEIEGRTYSLVGQNYFQEKDRPLDEVHEDIHKLKSEGNTLSYLMENDRLVGILSFSDQIKATAKQAIDNLHGRGIKTALITGDHEKAAEKIAKKIGVEQIFANTLPEDKRRIIESFQKDAKKVVMVGDGINDAPSLATADVGIAMGSGTDVALSTAGVALLRSDPNMVAATIDIGQATLNKIRQNLFWAFAYNVVGIPLASLGLLSPMLAGAAMALSSFCVVTNALRLRRWTPNV
ncbi:MAG: copper-translocating P-type ATPase [Pseudobacteriovorax sp.]|nr:copper-translocating P-type ATPase [Pseudobacteriovorax sp.]